MPTLKDETELLGPEDGIAPDDVAAMNPQDPSGVPHDGPPKETWPKTIQVTQHQAESLEKILEIDRTAWMSHGGLKGLLGITDSQVLALMDVVAALRK